MKRQFSIPLVFLTGVDPIDDPGLGTNLGGDNQDKFRPVPMSFEEWLQSRWVGDYDGDPGVDFKDYAKWFAINGFGTSLWDSLNPGVEHESDS